MTATSPLTAAPPARRPAERSPAARRGGPNWPLVFLACYIGFQVALLLLGSTALRAPLRVGSFAVSLGLVAVARPGRDRHPAAQLLPVIALCLVPGLFMGGQGSLLQALAQGTLYLATLAPLLWVSNRPLGGGTFRWVVLTLWGFNALSAGVGVLQVYYPGVFEAEMSSVVAESGQLGMFVITLANGQHALRPMGLTDSPGGATSGGMSAILFGVGLLFTERRWAIKALAVAGMVLGVFVIYLTQVRVTFLMTGIGVCVIAATFAVRGDLRRTWALLGVMLVVALVGTVWAFAIGGTETVDRFASLVQSQPADVYSTNRGAFLQAAFTEQIFDYPLGAGLGRWGMMAYYFGHPETALWAEIMWTSWIYDGGVPFLVLFNVMIALALWTCWRIGTSRQAGTLAVWGAVVLAYDVAAVAGTFDAPVFAGQLGLELWFLNACLYNAWRSRAAGLAAAAKDARRDGGRRAELADTAVPA